MSSLHQAAEEYVTVRRALGFKLADHGRYLTDLIDSLERAGARTITTPLALSWAMQSPSREMRVKRMAVARGFARYLQTLDPACAVPPTGLLPRRTRRTRPYLYAEAEIGALLAATATLRPPLRALTYRTIIGLLTVSGMRIGELLKLDRADVDVIEGVVTVREEGVS